MLAPQSHRLAFGLTRSAPGPGLRPPYHAPKNPGTVGGNPTSQPTFSTCLIITNYSNIGVEILGIINPDNYSVSTTQTTSLMTALGPLDSEKS
jgi:hypothetical protein